MRGFGRQIDVTPISCYYTNHNPVVSGVLCWRSTMEFVTRSLSPQESRVVLALAEQGRREIARPEIVQLLGVNPKAADHVINSLRRKGWLERASWGKYLLIPPAFS